MKRSGLAVLAIVAVFTLVGCGEISIPIPCLEDPIDTCIFMEMECNEAMTLGSICELFGLPAPIQEACEDLLGGGEWNLLDGTCQELQEAGGLCAEDDDCVNTCDLGTGVCL